jgi:Lipocalin-like domain
MKQVITLLLTLICASTLNAQGKASSKNSIEQELIGTWSLISVDNKYPDSSRVHPYGDNPQGMLIFDSKGNYAIQILKAVRPKVASGDKNTCTPEENAALVQGSNSHFGKYLVDGTTKTILFKIEHASFPNWEGTTQKRSYTFTGNEIKYVVTHTTQGGQSVVAEVAWRRLQ